MRGQHVPDRGECAPLLLNRPWRNDRNQTREDEEHGFAASGWGNLRGKTRGDEEKHKGETNKKLTQIKKKSERRVGEKLIR